MAETETIQITAIELRVGDRVCLEGAEPDTVLDVERITKGPRDVIVRIHLKDQREPFDAASWELLEIEPRGS